MMTRTCRALLLGIFAGVVGCSHATPMAETQNVPSESAPGASATATTPAAESKGEILLVMADAKPVFSVCKEMHQSFVKMVKGSKKMQNPKTKRYATFFIETSASDPTMLYQFRVPELRDFIKWSDKAGDNYWTLPEYKTESSKAITGLQNALPVAKRIDLRAYYASMIGRLMMARPAFAENSAVTETCQYVEDSLTSGKDEELRVKLAVLLKKASVSPKEIGYDPNWRSEIEVRDMGKMPMYFNTLDLRQIREHRATEAKFKSSKSG